jgi:adenine-specific DNA-methyltransferase
LPIAMLNSVTLLGAELCGRSYGGGILKIEPREADRLPLPSPSRTGEAATELRSLGSRLSAELGNRELDEVVEAVDEALLLGSMGLAKSEVAVLRAARQRMLGRRAARAGRPR